MAWIKWVARPDVPFKDAFHHTAIPNVVKDANIWDYPELKRLSKIDMLYIGNIIHLVREKSNPFYQTLIEIFDTKNSHCYLDLAAKYEQLGDELLRTTRKIFETNLASINNDGLLKLLMSFSDCYLRYCPILNSGVAVDWLYRDRYDTFIQEMTGRINLDLQRKMEVAGEPYRSIWAYVNMSDINLELSKALRDILITSPKETLGDQKEEALWKLAVQIALTPKALLTLSSDSMDYLKFRAEFPDVHRAIESCYREFCWTKMWSFPPNYLSSTFEEFLSELRTKLKPDVEDKYQEKIINKKIEKQRYEATISSLAMSAKERDFIDTINYYQYFRTWRMEVLTKSQYDVTPLLQEIGKRLKLPENDIFYLTYWEIVDCLKNRKTNHKVQNIILERRQGYAMWSKDGTLEIYSGQYYSAFMDEFLSVINFLENGRGLYYHETGFVGGKGNNLFKLVDSKINTAKFFVVTANAFKTFVQANGLREKITELNRKSTDNDKAIEELFSKSKFPESLKKAILGQIDELSLEEVAVRSSATVEDADTASWAGRFHSYMYVSKKNILDAIRMVWASLYNSIALSYALEHGVDLGEQAMAVIVQEMIDPELSGVVNTRLSNKNANIMEIETVYGQGEAIVSGTVTPDTYFVDKVKMTIFERSISTQTMKMTRNGMQTVGEGATSQKLSDVQILELANTCLKIENMYEAPQDIEYAFSHGKLFIIQSRPQTGLDTVEITASAENSDRGRLIATGLKGKVETVVKGVAKVLTNLNESAKLKDGEILVVSALTPAWDAIVSRAIAVVTDEGGSTSHAIRVSNERRISAIVGTGDASKLIKDGDTIIIDTTQSDSFRGRVYKI